MICMFPNSICRNQCMLSMPSNHSRTCTLILHIIYSNTSILICKQELEAHRGVSDRHHYALGPVYRPPHSYL